ncbi:MAG: hypothetical protein PVJ38_05045 [Candidatus Bathyarchaeota archaeon]|jgi:hypothetical protein
MSNYRIGAFEALQWAWYMMRNYRDHPGGVDEARKNIYQILLNMGEGADMDFEEEIHKFTLPH